MSPVTPASVQKLQTALHAKAKESPSFRFYALYDKVYRKDVLAFAYECCKANGGAAGVDGQRFEDIETYGVERWLDELVQELKSRTYQPLPVRRVYIPKPDGKQRPLGVPAIRDRTVEMAAVLVLEPIFEVDLQPEQYAYRRDRSALDAVNRVHKLIYAGHQEIVDADLSSYFDSIPHSELLQSVARRVVDGAMLHLSGEHCYVRGQLRRSKKQISIRGLNKDHNHDLKGLFKAAATRASVQPGPFQDFYQRSLAKGIKPTMVRLTLARKIAAITLTLWKKGENFDAEKLKSQAA